jgi:hypothetical protein
MEACTTTDTNPGMTKEQAYARAFEITLMVATRLRVLEKLREAVEDLPMISAAVNDALDIVHQCPEAPEDFFGLVDQVDLKLPHGRGNA